MRDLSTVLPLKSNLPGKFQRFSAIDGSIEMLKIVEFQKTLFKMKNFKNILRGPNNEPS